MNGVIDFCVLKDYLVFLSSKFADMSIMERILFDIYRYYNLSVMVSNSHTFPALHFVETYNRSEVM